jgi:hypothetical protein
VERKQKLREILEEYRLDQKEFTRILLIASTTLLIFSLHGLMTLGPASEKIDSLDSDYSRLSGMIGSQEFNNTIQSLEDVQGGEIGQRMQYAADVFRGVQDTGSRLEAVDGDLQYMMNMYRWLVLISILGQVAGVSLIYM